MLRPRPVPLPTGLVVKNGSNTWLGRLDAGSGVGELDEHTGVVDAGLNDQRAAADFFEGIDGVVDKIEENLENLVAVTADRRQGLLGPQLDTNAFLLEIEIAQVDGRGDGLVDIQQGFFRGHSASKAEQAAGEAFDPPGQGANFVDASAVLFREAGIVDQQIGISQDAGKGIIDFVSGACGELSDGNQFFGLNHLRLQILQGFEGTLRAFQQTQAITVGPTLPQKNEEYAHQDGATG